MPYYDGEVDCDLLNLTRCLRAMCWSSFLWAGVAVIVPPDSSREHHSDCPPAACACCRCGEGEDEAVVLSEDQ